MISILLATYNDEAYIREAVSSVLEQTYTEFELLIGFNGTRDSSKEIISSIHDPRIRVFDYGDDKGKAKTLNKMLNETKGDCCAIQDGDDVWTPKKLEMQMNLSKSFDVIGTQIFYINAEGVPRGGPELAIHDRMIKEKSLKGDNQVANTSAIFRKNHAQDISGWSEDLDGVEDFDFWLRLMKRNCHFVNLQTQEVYHRVHNRSNFNVNTYDIKKILH